MEKKRFRLCPFCGKPYSDAPALSRSDNETHICPDCGIREAMIGIGASEEEQNELLNLLHGKIKEFGLDGYSDSEAKPYTFANGDEMLSTLKEGIDLYNPEDELFVFLYNDAGSICSYRIDPKEAAELAKLAAEPEGECWSGFLGIGGSIFDDPHYENYNPKLPNNIDFCREHYRGSWFDTSIFKG